MNSREAPYFIMPVHIRSAVPGTGGMSLGSMAFRAPRAPQWMLEANYSSPATLIYVEEEGSDVPFRSRYLEALKLPPWLAKGARDRQLKILDISTWGLGAPLPILDAPPDDIPLFLPQWTEIPQDALDKRRLARIFSILRATESAPGYDPKKMPAVAYTVTVCEVLSKVQERLMEVPNSGVSWGSGLWSTPEVLRYLNDRLNHFIERTGLIRKMVTIKVEVGISEYDLPEDLMELNRISYTSFSSSSELIRIDKFQLDNGVPGWNTETGSPTNVVEEPLEYHTVQLYPIPDDNGTLELVYTPAFSVSNAQCDPLPIPSIFEPAITWGVIADMLKREGETHDPERAAYAEGRYEEGIELAKMMRGDG